MPAVGIESKTNFIADIKDILGLIEDAHMIGRKNMVI